MRCPADAKAQDTKRVEMLRQQALTKQRAGSLPALIAASRRKPHKHRVDEAEVHAHEQARRDARHDLRALASIGPAQLLMGVLNEAADEMLEEAVEMVAEDLLESVEDVAVEVIDEVDGVVGEMADDFLYLVHLD